MRKLCKLALIIVTLLFCFNISAQNVLDKINKYEKAVFSISSYTKDGILNYTTSGFFISPDGIGLAPSKVFLKADSINITLRNGRTYGVDRVLSTHKIANLAMFKAYDYRKKGFNYIVPSQNTERNQNEVLIISHPNETEDGVSLGKISKIFQAPFLDRVVFIDSNFDRMSEGSPVINNQGELVGIAGFSRKSGIHYYISTHTLNDTLWTDHPYNEWQKSLYNYHSSDLTTYMHKGIIHFLNEEWIEAAKNFSLAIRQSPNNAEAYILRGESRRQYENYVGMRDDFKKARSLSPNEFLVDYFDGRNLLKQHKRQEAFYKYVSSIEKYDSYAPALTDFGLLAVELRKDIETALKCYNKSIECSPLYAKGYYERSRLLQQYLNNDSLAMEDIEKAISLDKFLPGAYSIRGTLKILTENYMDAISDFDRALDIDPNDTHALFNRGLAYFNLGMKNKSCSDWEKAGQLGHFKSIKYISRYCSKVTTKNIGK
ncbi:serine protease [Plebeiibacterium marinum]|uniref:Trypsin-like peptidase domain-containing protein n=1 Tax=Plebeiibacterium marinum TaxID=2992111 RepID=A0AAE3MD11_9BACT|nr:serine protease [Plebeiobacterium marinum]MCW3805186.1 trypsin-like peptidase domain-containing protein [Plebeiobacterium marinum]